MLNNRAALLLFSDIMKIGSTKFARRFLPVYLGGWRLLS